MISIYCGKVEDLLDNFRDGFFDACLCDPPYGLKFMGKLWDHGVPSAAIWNRVLRVLKPGAPLLSFGGTRTYHRLAVAIEDAGFEIFDSILASIWVYGQGFPKSLDIGKAIDKAAGAVRPVLGPNPNHRPVSGVSYEGIYAGGNTGGRDITGPSTHEAHTWNGYGTTLKPAWEPVVCARKPLAGTYAENCIEHGVGGLNIDGTRITPCGEHDYNHLGNKRCGPAGNSWNDTNCGFKNTNQKPPNTGGRYPANLILSHHPDCTAASSGDAWECHPECPVVGLDRQSGPAGSNSMVSGPPASTDRFLTGLGNNAHHDTRAAGGASRFFYHAKVSTRERNHGLPSDLTCDHPTLKPIDLCRYLATLILPPMRANYHRNLLIPFSGAGSEIIGATLAGWESITAIEKESNYIEQAWYRIKAQTGIKASIFD